MEHELICRDRVLTAALVREGDGWRLETDGAAVAVELLEQRDGRLELRVDGRRRTVYAVRDGDRVLVFMAGRTWELRERDPDAPPDDGPGGGPRVTAEMPGKVVKVLVAPGQTVAAGEPLLVLEAMKMETEVAAGVAGTVAAVHVAPGQTVAVEELLVEIEPAAAPEGADGDG